MFAVLFTAFASLPIFSSFSLVVKPFRPAIAAPMMSLVHASSTLHVGGVGTSCEFRRMKFSDCARAYSRRSPSQSIIPPSHFMRIASSRESMYCFTDGSAMTSSIADAVWGPRVRVSAARDAATRPRHGGRASDFDASDAWWDASDRATATARAVARERLRATRFEGGARDALSVVART